MLKIFLYISYYWIASCKSIIYQIKNFSEHLLALSWLRRSYCSWRTGQELSHSNYFVRYSSVKALKNSVNNTPKRFLGNPKEFEKLITTPFSLSRQSPFEIFFWASPKLTWLRCLSRMKCLLTIVFKNKWRILYLNFFLSM